MKQKLTRNDLVIVFLDILAVNAAYFLALVARFYGFNFGSLFQSYILAFEQFAPFYTIFCITVFAYFKLYSGMWMYAGLRDLNRIILASICTCVFQVVGSILFVKRMPLSYYGLGAFFQFFFIVTIRMGHQLFEIERAKVIRRLSPSENVMIVGNKRYAKNIIRYLDDYNKRILKPVCIIDDENGESGESGRYLNGVPVIGGPDQIENGIEKYRVRNIIIADPFLDNAIREKLQKISKERYLELKDFTGFLTYLETEGDLLEIVQAPSTIDFQGTDKRIIPFSPPDISDKEINEVVATLKSGWITTGPRTKKLERRLAAYFETGETDVDTETQPERWNNNVVCLSSATAAEELNLRVLGIRPGDEVIVPAYTYTASASAAIHCGAMVKFIDIQKNGDPVTHAPEMDYNALEAAITEKTKAIIAVDFGGIVCDYDRIFKIVENKKGLFMPMESDGTPLSDLSAAIQRGLGCIAVVADCAHSLGASRIVNRNGEGRIEKRRYYCGRIAHFSSFSFHAVKNFTTAEGGAATWCLPKSVYKQGITNKQIYKMYQLLSLHGQNKDAFSKTKAGAWEYDIIGPWYKCNMTDIMAAIGLRQLDRYISLLDRRKQILKKYDETCDDLGLIHLVHHTEVMDSSNHLYPIRIPGIDTKRRNAIIEKMADFGVAVNVHYKPLPMMTAYKSLGWDIKDFQNTYEYYENLITLPLHTMLSDEDVDYVCESFRKVVGTINDVTFFNNMVSPNKY